MGERCQGSAWGPHGDNCAPWQWPSHLPRPRAVLGAARRSLEYDELRG